MRLEAPLSNGAACLKADFEGSLRNYYFQILKFDARRALFTEAPAVLLYAERP